MPTIPTRIVIETGSEARCPPNALPILREAGWEVYRSSTGVDCTKHLCSSNVQQTMALSQPTRWAQSPLVPPVAVPP